jgi:Flp pilus assembly protein TadG
MHFRSAITLAFRCYLQSYYCRELLSMLIFYDFSLTKPALQETSEEGQALVEFALVLPVMLLVVMGILWFGRALNYTQDETHLANIGARYAAVNQVPPNASAGETLAEWLRSQADTEELRKGAGDVQGLPKVCVKYPNGTGVGDPVEVSMTAAFKWLPLLKLATSEIKGSATMRIEVPPTSSFYAEGCSP